MVGRYCVLRDSWYVYGMTRLEMYCSLVEVVVAADGARSRAYHFLQTPPSNGYVLSSLVAVGADKGPQAFKVGERYHLDLSRVMPNNRRKPIEIGEIAGMSP